MKWWMAARDALQHSLPDDRLFVAMLTAWVVLLACVTYLLLGWESAGVLIAVAGLFGTATIATQSQPHRRNASPGAPPGRR
jgi:membrane associated rhomboid family serine protease